jgi:hypothetical protein
MAYLVIPAEYTLNGLSWKRPNYYNNNGNDTGGPSVAGFERWSFWIEKLMVGYGLDRVRTETVEFTMTADVQPLTTSREDKSLSVELSSSELDQPIDPGGLMPIRDIRRNAYLITDRGQQSLAYLMALCRVRLLARARAVNVSFTTTLAIGMALSLRHTVTITDPRIPGGTATGKVVSLTLSGDASSGVHKADVTIACTVGRGNAVGDVPTGTPEYVDPSYVEDGWQIYAGGAGPVFPDLYALSVTPTPITAGDTNIFTLTRDDALESMTVTHGSTEQAALLALGKDGSLSWGDTNEAVAALDAIATHVEVQMKALDNEEQITPYTPTVTDLMVPKTIDLEAS